jgi:cytochrome c peroxidase
MAAGIMSHVSGRPPAAGLTRPEAARRAAALREIGRQMFADVSLSASGRLACASCHRPDRALGPPDGLAVQPGGASGSVPGRRAVPTLRYLQAVPPFTRHYFASADDGDESPDNGPTGGLTWDGRADRGRDQARLPLFSPFEMANVDQASLTAKLLAAAYGTDLRRLSAEGAESDLETALEAVEAYEETPSVFAPYSSRYDAVLAGRAALSPEEARGLAAFNDPKRGNCASCHPSAPDGRHVPPVFTDFGYVALGVPRNRAISANDDPQSYDLGLCGPFRTDLGHVADYCGRFRTPTLRNVATREVFFHNGVVHSLRAAVAFYATRDGHPDRWYGRAPDGTARRFDDLPPAAWRNVETGPPFGLPPGAPALSDADIDAIVAFLGTLTDADVVVGARPHHQSR